MGRLWPQLPLLVISFLWAQALLPTAAKTFPGDVEALRHLKATLDPTSILPGSCISSWDFAAADPCDSLFSAAHFTCGFRCDAYDPAGLARVTDVSLDAAGYSGSLSPSVWSLPYLQTLDATENRLSGRIRSPPPSANLPQLRRVALSRNAFWGEIPVGNFPSLEELYLDGNRLSGWIPASTASLPSLRRLELQMNNLSGGIPDLRSMAVLTYLDASDNAISGPLPPASSLPASLVELSLRNNALEGTLPSALVAGLPNLQVLDLSHNRLSGRVPAALFSHPALEQLTLSRNRFTSLQSPSWWRPPADAGSSELVAVDLGHNRLWGTLPLGWVGAMPRLTALILENNRLSGMIPTEYAMRVASSSRAGSGVGAGVSRLARLVLAGNYLYGPIPGPLTGVKEGEATVSLADNCLFHCPKTFFFCHGGHQKQPTVCRGFNPVIP